MIKNDKHHYGSVSRFFHWTMAALLIAMFIIAYTMLNLPKSALRLGLYNLHKSTGLLLFCLVAARLIWISITPHPVLSDSIPKWQIAAAKANVVLLYILMFAMPITGFLRSSLGGYEITVYNLFTINPLTHNSAWGDLFSLMHEYIGYTLIAAFVMHVAAVGYHQYFLKDNLLKKMA